MTNSAYQLILNPVLFDKYSFGKIELDDFQLSNLNLILSKLSQSKEATFNDSFGIEWELSFVGFIDYLINKVGDPGPFLIVTRNYLKWADIISNVSGITPLIYKGSQQERKAIRNNQMFNQDKTLKFNVLISTTDLSEIDFSSINSVFYHLSIYHNFKKVKYMPKSCKTIRYTQESFVTFSSDSQEIGNFTNESYFNDSDFEKQQEKIENFENLLTSIPSEPILYSPKYYYINCPLCNIQKNVLKNLFFESEQNFPSLCQMILRICTHPFLVFGTEYLLGPVDYIQSSTKLSVLSKLVTEKLTDAKKILVISQFNGMLDLVEDFATERNISYNRLINPEIDYENQDILLMLYNPLYCQIDIITEFIDYFIILDGDHSIILNSWLSNANRKLKAVYTLQCQELFETRLTKICMRGLNLSNKISNTDSNNSPYQTSKTRNNSSYLMNSLKFQYSYNYSNQDLNHDFSHLQFDEFMSELLCKISATVALSPIQEYTIDSLIDNFSNEPIETSSLFDIQFCQAANFWDTLRNTIEYKTKPEFPLIRPIVDNEKHNWTLRERDQLIRGLLAFGLDRWDEIIHNGGLHLISKETIIQVSRSLLRFLLRSLPNSPFLLIRQFIRESSNGDQNSSLITYDEKADQMFMEKDPAFSQKNFKSKMKSIADFFLKRIESLSYLKLTVENYIGNISSLPISRTIGNSPTLYWTGNNDRYLLIGSYKYGYGSYDHFPEDQDTRFSDISYCADQILLNERLLKLTENLKRMHDAKSENQKRILFHSESENSDNFDEGYKERKENNSSNASSRRVKVQSSDDDNDDIDDSNAHYNLSCHWSKEEKSQVFKFMSDYGVISDFEAMRNEVHLETKTAEQLKEYVEDYMERCKIKPEDGGIKAKTAAKTKKRVTAMEELRTILNFELQNHPDLYQFQSQPQTNKKSRTKNENSDDDGDAEFGTDIVPDYDNSLLFEKIRWKNMPNNWTPFVERFFFTQIAINGLKSINDIKLICERRKVIDFKTLPPFVGKVDSIFKRIHSLYESLLRINPSLAQTQFHQNQYFYNFQQNYIQQDMNQPIEIPQPKYIESPKIKLKSSTIDIKSPTSEVKQNSKSTINLKKPTSASSRKVQKDKSDEDSSQSENDYSDESDEDNYSDEYKTRSSRSSTSSLSQTRRSQTKPVVHKEDMKDIAHKVQTKQQHQNQNKSPHNQQQKQMPNLGSLSIDNFKFPIAITATSFIISIGEIVYDRPAFHTERYIYPAGYKSMKVYYSIDNPNERVNYISEIIDNGSEMPLFRVTMEGSQHIFEGITPTAPWSNVLKAVSSQGEKKVYSVSGPEAFLLAQTKVLFLIQLLPNVDKCQKYVPKVISNNVINELLKQSKQTEKNQKEQVENDKENENNENQNNDDNENKEEEYEQKINNDIQNQIENQPELIENNKNDANEISSKTELNENEEEIEIKQKEEKINPINDYVNENDENEAENEEDESDDDDDDESDFEDKITSRSRSGSRTRQKNQTRNQSSSRSRIQEDESSQQEEESDDEKTRKRRPNKKTVQKPKPGIRYETERFSPRNRGRSINYNTDNEDEEENESENDKDNEDYNELSYENASSSRSRRRKPAAQPPASPPTPTPTTTSSSPRSKTRNNNNSNNQTQIIQNENEIEKETEKVTKRINLKPKQKIQNKNDDDDENEEETPEFEDDDDDDESPAYEEDSSFRSRSANNRRPKPKPKSKPKPSRSRKIVQNDEDENLPQQRQQQQKPITKKSEQVKEEEEEKEDSADDYDKDEIETTESDSPDFVYNAHPSRSGQTRRTQNKKKEKVKENDSSSSSSNKSKEKNGNKKKNKVDENLSDDDNDDGDDDSDRDDFEYKEIKRRSNQRKKKK